MLNFVKFWKIENTGSNSETNKFDHNQFIEKNRWNSDRYTVPSPWKLEHDILPDNFTNSLSRLKSGVFFRLKKDSVLLKDYDNIIKQHLKETISERVPRGQDITPGRVYYIPHHAVGRADKETTKLRIVYDASSNSPSLNDCLEKGPCLLPLIFDILVRFRAYRVA